MSIRRRTSAEKNTNPLEATFIEDDKIKKDPAENIKQISYFNLYRYATHLDRFYIITAILGSLASGVGMPLMMILFGNITQDFINYATGINQPGVTEDEIELLEAQLLNDITDFAVYAAIIGGATFLLTYVATLFYNWACIRQISVIRSKYMKNVLNQDISWYDQNQTGDFSSRISGDMVKVEEGIGDKVTIFFFFISTFIAGIITAFIYGWLLTLICLINLPVTLIALGIVGWLTNKFAKQESESYAAAGAIAEETLTAVKTVFAFSGQQKEIDRYKSHLIHACKNNITRALWTAVSNALIFFFMFASYALSFWYGITLIIDELHLDFEDREYTPGVMITVFFNVLMSSFTLGQTAPYITIFGAATGAATKIFSIIDNAPIINLNKNNGNKLNKIKGNIKFRGVHFEYPSRSDVKILNGVDIDINPGQTVALVGSSGCGKSTCIQLIQRFYDPTQGILTIDGVDVKDFDLTWFRSNVGVVGQEPILFGTTIAENIRFGTEGIKQEDIERAARKANAHQFIIALPHGYNTLVGQRGSQMSGGQKQRIAIARALVRNPSILLLDEATSALDTNSEAQVQRAIDAIRKECTTIIVAHRLSTIRNADKIVVFQHGKVVEEGNHETLMSLNGVYYNLVITQINTNDEAKMNRIDRTNSVRSQTSENESENIAKMIEIEEEIEEDNNSGVCKAIGNLLKLNRPEWWQITIGAIAALIAGAAMPVYAVVFGRIIGTLALDDPEAIRYYGDRYSLYFLLIGIVSGITTFGQWYFINISGEKLTRRVRGVMFEAVLRQEIGWYDRKENGVGAICTKLSSDAANIQGAAGHPIIVVLNSSSTLIIAAGLSIYFEWRLALVSLSIVPIILIATYLESKLQMVTSTGSKNALESSTKIAVEAVGNIRTVASLGCEETFYTLYTTEMLPYYAKAKRNAHVRGIIMGLSRSLIYFSYIIAFYYGGHLILNDGLAFENVFKVAEALISAAMSVGGIMAFAPNFQKGIIAANKMSNLVARVPEIQDDENSTSTGWSSGHIKYNSVQFTYPTRPNIQVLNSLDLSVSAGKTIALVGPSGCGKSTIIQLIQRFYDPSSGSVNIDEINIRNIKIMALRSHLGIVSQEPNLFDRTIAENIAYGDNTRLIPMEEVIQAAKKSNIHSFVSSLPLGYDTRLGDKGAQLSGGQKQRVAIARALVRNPQILLLDEATSALDMESEKIVQEALDAAKAGRTCITIAHRLTTIQDADVICVMDKGDVIEQGTHDELLRLRGLYHKLYSIQQGH
ncbi:ATP-dependent translocase ABCB1-like isoform X1 [Onthophagus taurus]|uniref:ATP-dependent translocase ABCB1-like isoform X1 n=2 Tax=Onthophagus taurus TaxID=166361 RepID=UPI0039BE9C6B